MLQERPGRGETWEDVIKKGIEEAEEYIGGIGCYPIPSHTASGLVHSVYYGRRMAGHFLNAVFDNNLSEAFGRADLKNIIALNNIVKWVYNVAPQGLRNPDFPGLISIAAKEKNDETSR